MRVPVEVRILQRSVAALNGCIVFTGHKNNAGYGMISVRDGTRKGSMALAHRQVYLALVGEIPAGMVIDHVCGNRACVNHYHLEAVTQFENVSRGLGGRKDTTLCRAGLHPWFGYMYDGGGCPSCKVEAQRRRRRKQHNVQFH